MYYELFSYLCVKNIEYKVNTNYKGYETTLKQT